MTHFTRFLSGVAGAMVVAAGFGAPRAAQGVAQNWRHGVVCNPTNPTDAPNLVRTWWGIHNNSTTTDASVDCDLGFLPLPSDPASPTTFYIDVFDRSPSEAVTCTVGVIDDAGNVIGSNTASSTGSTATSPREVLMKSVTMAGHGYDWVRCVIPPKTAAGALSHVMSLHGAAI